MLWPIGHILAKGMARDAETRINQPTKVSDSPSDQSTVMDSHGEPPASAVQKELDTIPAGPTPELVSLLGKGGMAKVHVAIDEPLGREVALKQMLEDESEDAYKKHDFVREARITGQLQHPNIVPVYSIAKDSGGTPFFSMQVIEGRNLRQWLSHPHRSIGSRERLEKGIEILLRVCDAVAFAHSKGVLHRDIKPDNIMVGPFGQVYLMDWGLATTIDGMVARTGGGAIAGTVGYMAPEQARAEPLDERADVFGLGAVLYKIVAGTLPYSETAGSMLKESAAGNVKPLDTAPELAQLTKGLAKVINRSVAADRADRYRTVESFQTELRAFLHSGLLLPRRAFLQDEVVVKQGDPADAAYMILEGSCRVLIQTESGTKEVRTMNTGDIFGELALLLDAPRTATVIANEPTRVLVIDREAFEARGVLDDGWSRALFRALAERFRDLEQQVRN